MHLKTQNKYQSKISHTHTNNNVMSQKVDTCNPAASATKTQFVTVFPSQVHTQIHTNTHTNIDQAHNYG